MPLDNSLRASAPASVRESSVPDPKDTIKIDKKDFRKNVEVTTSEVELPQGIKEEERVFEKADEPEIMGSIVITIYKNNPYDVEFEGHITGFNRDLAIRALMKGYTAWKIKVGKQQEAEIARKEKLAEQAKKEKDDAGN